MTIIPNTVDKNPLEKMEKPSKSTEESEIYLDVASKMTEWSWFSSKAKIQYHSNLRLGPNY